MKRCWRKEQDIWVLRDIAFTDDWNESDYETLAGCLQNTIRTGGVVIGVFENNQLVGFASVENERLGSRGQYFQLSSLHISRPLRGKGIGRRLFEQACKQAQKRGAEKLYISSHSAEETQGFYRARGCADAEEIQKTFAEAEPCDCQLEFVLPPSLPQA